MKILIELELSNNKLLHYDVKTIEQGIGRPKKINEIIVEKKHAGRPKKIVNIIPIPPILPPVIPNKEVVTVPTEIPAPQPPVEQPKPTKPPELSEAQKKHIIELKMILKSIEQKKALKNKVESYRK
jgi:hypothetical protein